MNSGESSEYFIYRNILISILSLDHSKNSKFITLKMDSIFIRSIHSFNFLYFIFVSFRILFLILISGNKLPAPRTFNKIILNSSSTCTIELIYRYEILITAQLIELLSIESTYLNVNSYYLNEKS